MEYHFVKRTNTFKNYEKIIWKSCTKNLKKKLCFRHETVNCLLLAWNNANVCYSQIHMSFTLKFWILKPHEKKRFELIIGKM